MATPTLPSSFLPRPFADSGIYQLIPDDKPSNGRASFKEGFPSETQLPLSSGGVAPSRPDFNGILHMLSALSFWQQSGGLWVYKTTLDYNTPSLVYHNNNLWYCKAPNGPSTSVPGIVAPGTNTNYWITALDFLSAAGSGGEGGSTSGNPVGTVIMHAATTAPKGYLVCNGQSFNANTYPLLYKVLGGVSVPDMRGLFVRGYDPTGIKDSSVIGRQLRTFQDDAIRNIAGYVSIIDDQAIYPSGPFTRLGAAAYDAKSNRSSSNAAYVYFDASRVVPVSNENRPKNINMLYCIKHD